MSTRPLVSVLTPTWQRPDLLMEAVGNVRAQAYRPLEHVIVSDGPDPELGCWLAAIGEADRQAGVPERAVLICYVELGRNWSTYLVDSFVAAPTTVAMLLARGDYQLWLADDERMAPDHIAGLVDALEAAGADFAYSRVELSWPSGRREGIGTDPPREGQITNVLYRTDLLKRGLYPFGAGMTSDWACIRRWMEAGATWAFVDRTTLTHVVDH